MTMTAKILGQVSPAANTDTAVYSPGTSTTATVSTVVICNTNTSTGTTYNLAVKAAADTLGTKNYLVYQANLDPKETVTMSLGITLGAGDSIRALCGIAGIAVSAFGVERT